MFIKCMKMNVGCPLNYFIPIIFIHQQSFLVLVIFILSVGKSKISKFFCRIKLMLIIRLK